MMMDISSPPQDMSSKAYNISVLVPIYKQKRRVSLMLSYCCFISDATERQNLSCADVYLQACRRIGTPPISSFLRHMNEATVNLNHYSVGPMGAKALAIALQVWLFIPQITKKNKIKIIINVYNDQQIQWLRCEEKWDLIFTYPVFEFWWFRGTQM